MLRETQPVEVEHSLILEYDQVGRAQVARPHIKLTVAVTYCQCARLLVRLIKEMNKYYCYQNQ